MLTTNDITRLKNGLDIVEQHEGIVGRLNYLNDPRVKQEDKDSLSFSPRLNNYINTWFEQYKDTFVFTDEDDFDADDIEGTLGTHIRRYKRTGKIHIWTGASENTIFADATVNHKFRAWHDYIHITNNIGYDFVGESIVSSMQQAQLPLGWEFEKELIHCEVVGQGQYFMKWGEFLLDQRKFSLEYLNSPVLALNHRQVSFKID